MTKFFAMALVLALLLPVLAGCQGAQSAGAPQSDNELSQQQIATTPLASLLAEDAALAIVFADAQVTKEDIRELEVELDRTGTSSHYDVDFEKDGQDYDYEIDAETGKILKKEVPQPAQDTSAEATKITRDEALKIALEDAGLTQDQIRDLEVELDKDGGELHYDVDFEVNDKDYDYEIDAETGKILKKQVPKQASATTSSSSSSSSSSSASKYISRTEARDIALKHAGLSSSQVRDLEVELDKDGGTVHYDVDFEADGYDYDYEINAESGKILKSEKERD